MIVVYKQMYLCLIYVLLCFNCYVWSCSLLETAFSIFYTVFIWIETFFLKLIPKCQFESLVFKKLENLNFKWIMKFRRREYHPYVNFFEGAISGVRGLVRTVDTNGKIDFNWGLTYIWGGSFAKTTLEQNLESLLKGYY